MVAWSNLVSAQGPLVLGLGLREREPLFQQATLDIITLTLQHDDKLSHVIWNKISNINLTCS